MIPRRWHPAGRWIVGLGLLGVLVAVVGPAELAATARRAALGWLVLVVVLNLLWLLLGALNVWILLRRLVALPWFTFLPAYLLGWATSLLLPGQLGDATQVAFLRRHGVPMGKSGAAYLVDKSVTLVLVVLVAFYGTRLYLPNAIGSWWLILPAALIAGPLGLLLLLRRRPAGSQGLPARLRRGVGRVLSEIGELRHHPDMLVVNLILTVIKWVLLSILYFGAFRAFGFELEPEAAATIPMMSSIAGYLPVSVSGIGTVEWTAVALFRQAGANSALVLSVYLLLRVTQILTALGLVATRATADLFASVPDARKNAGH